MMKPTDFGFADNGERWQALGGTEALFATLEKKGVAKRDWFVRGGWAQNTPTAFQYGDLSDLYPIQDDMFAETVDRYAQGEFEPSQETFEKFPTVFIWHGFSFVLQGTHRLAAQGRLGRFDSGWIVDVDSL